MKIPERYKCDFCGKDNPEHRGIPIPVITDCEWTEGRVCQPYINSVRFDICDECFLLTTNVHCGFRGEDAKIVVGERVIPRKKVGPYEC